MEVFSEALEDVEPTLQDRAKRKMEEIRQNPGIGKWLIGPPAGFRSAYVGKNKYRIIYFLIEEFCQMNGVTIEKCPITLPRGAKGDDIVFVMLEPRSENYRRTKAIQEMIARAINKAKLDLETE